MRSAAKRSSAPARIVPESGQGPIFTEKPAWSEIGAGWRPLFGNYAELGFSFEWHEFRSKEDLDWGRSFHPRSLELCLNLEGTAQLNDSRGKVEVQSQSWVFYYQGEPPLVATRSADQLHRFITVEFAPDFLKRHFGQQAANLHPLIKAVVQQEVRSSEVAPAEPMGVTLLQLVESLRHCPVFRPAQEVWFQCKALELVAQLFFQPPAGELFCTRAQRSARERVERARALLKERLQTPPSLDELGRLVGCSPFYLSRQFSQETGMTIQQYLQKVRLERAAELLRSGRCNVTEAALEVGYSSLSHFSTMFREVFGCCPGLYPIQFHKLPSKKSN